MDHQVINNHAEASTDTKGIFNELMGLHKTHFISIKSFDYMQ
jgi:hypothetical protein